jgi:two-component system sensor histidine kinase SaeS
VFASIGIALLVVIATLNPPAKDVQDLFMYMFGTSLFTIGLAYFLYRGRILQWFNSLRWALLATIVLTMLLILVNVWVTARLMFINEHDLALTAALLIFAGVVSIVAVFFISGAMIERIQDLGQGTQQLAQGDLEVRLPEQGNDELAQLAKLFNTMAESLQTLDDQKRQLEQTRRDLIAWVSHDLRTPLAAIQAMNEAILDGVAGDTQTTTRYTENIQREIEHLRRMIDDLFELTKLDTERVNLVKEKASLRDLISDTLGSMEAQAAQHNIRLKGTVEDGIDVMMIAPDKVQRVLYNLLGNAIRHTPTGGEVGLLAKRVGECVQIGVHNSGSIISETDLPHIFKSFYRGERSRAQERDGYRGTGLGLAIARGFVEAHGGEIWVESDEKRGTTFTFTLPL